MGYVIGIDVGTTYTAAAVSRGDCRSFSGPEAVGLGTRAMSTASVAFLADDGRWLIGDAAERRAHERPDLVVREFKRRIGDPVPLVVDGQRHRPEALVAEVVRWVTGRVAEREGGPAAAITVTHPASWGSYKRALVHNAIAEVGLPDVNFLSEPVAAAAHYATQERVEVGSTIAVYDLGGGTFDAAIVRKVDERSFSLLGTPQGIDRLGGVDFDQAVFGHVHASTRMPPIDPTDPGAVSAMIRLRRECTEAKEALSADTDATIPVLLPNLRTRVRLVRSEFEELVRNAVEETVDALQGTIDSAGVASDEIDAVLLVGGSSRIPLIAQVISSRLRRPIVVDADPKTSIALGAASMAAWGVQALAEPRSPQLVTPIDAVGAATAPAARGASSLRQAPRSATAARRRLPTRIGAGTVAASVGIAAVAGAAIAVAWPAKSEDGRPAVVEARLNSGELPSPASAATSTTTAASPLPPSGATVPSDPTAALPVGQPLFQRVPPGSDAPTATASRETTGRSPSTMQDSVMSAATSAALPVPLAGVAMPVALSAIPTGTVAPAATALDGQAVATTDPVATVPGAGLATGTMTSPGSISPTGSNGPTDAASPSSGTTTPRTSGTTATTSPATPSRTTVPRATAPPAGSPGTTVPQEGGTQTSPPGDVEPPDTEPPAPSPSTPADNPPVDDTPDNSSPADDPPVDSPPADTTPADNPPVDDPPPDASPPADSTVADGPPADDGPTGEQQVLRDDPTTIDSTPPSSDPTDSS